MKLQSGSGFLRSWPPPIHFSPPQFHAVSKHHRSHTGLTRQIPGFQVEVKSVVPSLRCKVAERAANLISPRKWDFRVFARKGSDPFRGKSGSVSFGGLSHQSVEESKLVSTPFKEGTGSILWALAPVALISALVVPQFFVASAVEDAFKNEVFAEIVSSFSTEIIFYAGLAIFLFVTERVQKPYLEFSPRRWSLITGLKGYLTSAFFTMGFKVFAPLIAVYVTWPVLGYSALVSVAPLLTGCLAQYVFEKSLDRNGSSCWPLIPIIFEVYRIYQLTRATGFIEKLIYGMREASVTPAVMERTGALISMIVTFRILGVVCLWSLLTFLLRLFPSRPVAENY
ncbi:tRNA-processing ribonuclease BN [Perilla frutescens var. hirtella]|nr:tRNA-processing ribonuclease BN [Perilla frutescens var. frutescens]KAH6776499.1 tRNA-processing ribonuclease BN [Perilla frutescens var. hirtella]